MIKNIAYKVQTANLIKKECRIPPITSLHEVWGQYAKVLFALRKNARYVFITESAPMSFCCVYNISAENKT